MIKKNITIEDLTRMIQKGFLETAKKIEVDKRFDKVEDRLQRIKKLLYCRTSSENRKVGSRHKRNKRIISDKVELVNCLLK